MKILIFGATGSTGKLLVQGAREWGHQVTAFVRDPSKLDRRDVHFIHGDITDPESVRQAIAGKDAVISALGSRSRKRDPDLVAGMRNNVCQSIPPILSAHRRYRCAHHSGARVIRRSRASLPRYTATAFKETTPCADPFCYCRFASPLPRWPAVAIKAR